VSIIYNVSSIGCGELIKSSEGCSIFGGIDFIAYSIRAMDKTIDVIITILLFFITS